jgi:hypothetical protein
MTGLMPLPLTANYQDPLQVQELWQEIQGVAQISKVAL